MYLCQLMQCTCDLCYLTKSNTRIFHCKTDLVWYNKGKVVFLHAMMTYEKSEGRDTLIHNHDSRQKCPYSRSGRFTSGEWAPDTKHTGCWVNAERVRTLCIGEKSFAAAGNGTSSRARSLITILTSLSELLFIYCLKIKCTSDGVGYLTCIVRVRRTNKSETGYPDERFGGFTQLHHARAEH